MTVTKRRTWTSHSFEGKGRGHTATKLVVERQETQTDSHQVSRLGVEGDIGGKFFTTSTWSYYVAPHVVLPEGIYDGPLFAVSNGTDGKIGSPAAVSVLDLAARGATAIARTIPTNPYSGAAAFIGEIREGAPRIIGSALLRERVKLMRKDAQVSATLRPKGGKVASDTGSEYLNVEFGWKPLVADIRKFARAVKDSNKVITQFQRDAGRHVRRRYEFPEVAESSFSERGWAPGTVFGQLRIGEFDNGVQRTEDYYRRKVWFAGAYKYALPQGDDLLSKVKRYEQEANRLLGTRLTPDTLWQLAPWSWANDWFFNTGDVIRNLTALSFDGLALQYGYVMCEQSREVRYIWSGRYINSARQWTPVSCMTAYGGITKQRQPATPFGFGLSWDNFTPRQIAIAAAIGTRRLE